MEKIIKKFLSTSEVATILGISRQAVLEKIKLGKIHAKKVGRSFIVQREDLPAEFGGEITERKKQVIDAAIKRTIADYGATLKLLGKE